MSLIDYISGIKRGKEANRLEKDSQKDPFLFEALEGYENITGDHLACINKMQKAIGSGRGSAKRSGIAWKVAASVALFVCGIGGYLYIDDIHLNTFNQEANTSSMGNAMAAIDISVPEEFYEQNEGRIENSNNILAQYSPMNEEAETLETLDAMEDDLDEVATQSSVTKRKQRDDDKNKSIDHLAGNMEGNMQKESVTDDYSQETSIIEIYVPSEFYEQHKEDIDKNNTVVEDMEGADKKTPIVIYIPENDYIRFKDKIEK